MTQFIAHTAANNQRKNLASQKDPLQEPEIRLTTRKTPQQIREIIAVAENFPLDRIISRYMADKCVDPEVAASHARELKRFLALSAIYDGPLAMRGPVDDFWHTFLLFTEQYHSFCNDVAGTFLHHVPHADDAPSCRSAIDTTRFNLAYAATFGQAPDAALWPEAGYSPCLICLALCGSHNCSVTAGTAL